MKNHYKLALITGGSSGIGLALAKQLAHEGVSVCLLARDKEKLSQAVREIEKKVGKNQDQFIDAISCDVTDCSSGASAP